MALEDQPPNIERLVEASRNIPKQLWLPPEFKGYVSRAKTLVDKDGNEIKAKHVSGAACSVPQLRKTDFDMPLRMYGVDYHFCTDLFPFVEEGKYLAGLTKKETCLLLGNDFPVNAHPTMINGLLFVVTYPTKYIGNPYAFVIDEIRHRDTIRDRKEEVACIEIDFYKIGKRDYRRLLEVDEEAQKRLIDRIRIEHEEEQSYLSWLRGHEEFMRAVRDLHKSLRSSFVCQGFSKWNLEKVMEEAKDYLSRELRPGLDKLVASLVARGAEEAALVTMETFDYSHREREEMARKAYESIKNHIQDSDFGLSLFVYCAEDGAQQELKLARIAKSYPIGVNPKEHAQKAVDAYERSNSMSANPERMRKFLDEIRTEFELVQ